MWAVRKSTFSTPEAAAPVYREGRASGATSCGRPLRSSGPVSRQSEAVRCRSRPRRGAFPVETLYSPAYSETNSQLDGRLCHALGDHIDVAPNLSRLIASDSNVARCPRIQVEVAAEIEDPPAADCEHPVCILPLHGLRRMADLIPPMLDTRTDPRPPKLRFRESNRPSRRKRGTPRLRSRSLIVKSGRLTFDTTARTRMRSWPHQPDVYQPPVAYGNASNSVPTC